MRTALEAALVADPDDLSAHMAYADHLSEQGDPRGEFIQVQLALEDPSRSSPERRKLRQREKKLLAAHEREWLGGLAPFLLDGEPRPHEPYLEPVYRYAFARGWLATLDVANYKTPFTRALAQAPEIRLLRRLILKREGTEDPGTYEPHPDIPSECPWPAPFLLLRTRYLANVRVLQMGEQVTRREEDEAYDESFACVVNGEAAAGLAKLMPRLEELYLLAHHVDAHQLFALKTLHNLRILQLYHSHSYPLARLASNPTLGNLTHLLLHPHAMDEEVPYIRLPGVRALLRSANLPRLTHLRLRLSDMGDKGCDEIVHSGILKRLKVLDLRHGCITDSGARVLAVCPDLRNLELLDLFNNWLTRKGIAVLRATGVRLDARTQYYEGDETVYFGGDME